MSNTFSHDMGATPSHLSTTMDLTLVVRVLILVTCAVEPSLTMNSCGNLRDRTEKKKHKRRGEEGQKGNGSVCGTTCVQTPNNNGQEKRKQLQPQRHVHSGGTPKGMITAINDQFRWVKSIEGSGTYNLTTVVFGA